MVTDPALQLSRLSFFSPISQSAHIYFHQHLKAQTQDKLAFWLVPQMVNYDLEHFFGSGLSCLLLLPDPPTQPVSHY